MVAQKCKKKKKKNWQQKIFSIFEDFYHQTHLIKSLNTFDSSRPYGKLLENQKTGGSKELFLHENDFQNSSTKNITKKHPDFGGLETNQRHEI